MSMLGMLIVENLRAPSCPGYPEGLVGCVEEISW